MFMATWWTIIVKFFLFAIPMIIAIYFGAEAVGNFITQLPEWITNALNATGKLLPALGFAMTINVIGRPQFLPFFLGGFFFAPVSYTHLAAEDAGSQKALEADEEGKHLLTKRDVNNLVFRWQILAEVPNSFARLQSLSFCAAFIPILKKLYGHDPEELSAALTRHLTFFNTEGVWGSVVHGIRRV